MTTLYLGIGAIVTVVMAFFGGQYAGKRQGRLQARYRAAERDLQAVKRRDERKQEIEGETDEDLVDRITGDPE